MSDGAGAITLQATFMPLGESCWLLIVTAHDSPGTEPMPIRPELRPWYSWDWPHLSASIRFRRAAGRCEACGRQHGHEVQTFPGGAWFDADLGIWRDDRGKRTALPRQPQVARSTRVVLATAHLNHDPTDNRGQNLKALFGRCHLAHDREEHRQRRFITYRARRALGDLFLGPYRP